MRVLKILSLLMFLFSPVAFADETQKLKIDRDDNFGMDGYCVVSLVEPGVWIKREKDIFSEYDGIRYLFISDEEKRAFEKDPISFAPAFRGNDPIELIENDKTIRGRREFGLRYDKNGTRRTFLFSNREKREKFDANPTHYYERIQVFEEIEARVRSQESKRGKRQTVNTTP